MATPKRRDLLDDLANIASSQEGFFSAAQAQEAGIPRQRLARLVSSGILERDKRGIYRFASYPDTENAELWRAVLWPNVSRSLRINKLGKGVLSHATALDLWNVSTINPAKLDITLPKHYRIRRGVPSVYRLHRVDLTDSDITFILGLPTTTLYRTLLDLILDGREYQFVDEALNRPSPLSEEERHKLQALRLLGVKTLDEVCAIRDQRRA
jgi:predicted transcriptional regulator of viral defense system